jgi:hypothetical protein
MTKEEIVRVLKPYLLKIKDKTEIMTFKLPDNLGNIVTSANYLLKQIEQYERHK